MDKPQNINKKDYFLETKTELDTKLDMKSETMINKTFTKALPPKETK